MKNQRIKDQIWKTKNNGHIWVDDMDEHHAKHCLRILLQKNAVNKRKRDEDWIKIDGKFEPKHDMKCDVKFLGGRVVKGMHYNKNLGAWQNDFIFVHYSGTAEYSSGSPGPDGLYWRPSNVN